jgi:hypothetical protein
MIYARRPTEEEHIAPKRMAWRAIGPVSQRAHLLRLSAPEHPGPELANLFAMSRATVRFWIRRFNARSPAGLNDDPRRRRPRQVGPPVLETLGTMLQDAPVTKAIWPPAGRSRCWPWPSGPRWACPSAPLPCGSRGGSWGCGGGAPGCPCPPRWIPHQRTNRG